MNDDNTLEPYFTTSAIERAAFANGQHYAQTRAQHVINAQRQALSTALAILNSNDRDYTARENARRYLEQFLATQKEV